MAMGWYRKNQLAALPLSGTLINPSLYYQAPDKPWMESLAALTQYGRKEAVRRLEQKGSKRDIRNFGQYKANLLPILEAEVGEDFYSRGIGEGTLMNRTLTKTREPFRRHEQELATRHKLLKANARKERIWDTLSLGANLGSMWY